MKFNHLGIIFIGIFLTTLFLACKSEGEKATDTPAEVETTPPKPGTTDLGSISPDVMRELWDNCTAIDIIFYETNFSISQDEQPAIRNTLGYFLPTPVAHYPACKPIGRLTFIGDGAIMQEADIYNAKGCQYFIWLEDSKPAFINTMAPQGIAFFDQVMKQGKAQQ